MAATHILIALFFALSLFLINHPLIKNVKDFVTRDYMNTFMFFLIMAGSCLLPDLDGEMSYAGFKLGIFGKLLSLGMISTSAIFTSIVRTKNDFKGQLPDSQHRKLWHRPEVGVLLAFSLYFFVPSGKDKIITLLQSKNLSKIFMDNYMLFIVLILSCMCIILGVNAIIWRISILLPYKFQTIIKLVCIIGGVLYMLFRPYDDIKYIGLLIGIGYCTHLFGDLFTQGSVPLPWLSKKGLEFWHCPWILGPFQIYTGGIVNKILDMTFTVLDCFLVYLILFKK